MGVIFVGIFVILVGLFNIITSKKDLSKKEKFDMPMKVHCYFSYYGGYLVVLVGIFALLIGLGIVPIMNQS